MSESEFICPSCGSYQYIDESIIVDEGIVDCHDGNDICFMYDTECDNTKGSHTFTLTKYFTESSPMEVCGE